MTTIRTSSPPSPRHPERPPRIRGRSRGRIPLFATAIAWLYAVVSIYPLVWLVFSSLRSDGDILRTPFGLPVRANLDAYRTAFDAIPLPRYFLNSLVVTVAVMILSVVCCAGAGYAFSRAKFPGSGALYPAFIAALVVPAPVLLIPVFLISHDLGLLDSYVGLIGPYVAGTLPVGVYLMKTHFDSLPEELAEAAVVDGASPWQAFRYVMFPLIRPAAATVAVLSFTQAWNEYIWALVSLQDSAKYTLPVGIADLSAKKFIHGYAPTYAAMVVTMIPVIAVFVAAQRSFITSITAGAVKG